MRNNEFWAMVKKPVLNSNDLINHRHPYNMLPAFCIIEWTKDELVYVWPKEPNFKDLCFVCKNMKLNSSSVCKSDIPSGYPCNFKAVPEAELSQDFDDFLVDGEYIVECGYYYNFEDFKRQNNYTDEDFIFIFLGTFPSIRYAREAFYAMSNAESNSF